MSYNDTWSADDAQLSVLRENVRKSEERMRDQWYNDRENVQGWAYEPVCIICHKPILNGELVTGQDWTGQGGTHVTCEQGTELG